MKKLDKGISILFVIGSYGGFHATYHVSAFHVCIAFFAITVFFYDAENKIAHILKSNKLAKKKLETWAQNSNYSTKGGDLAEILDLLG